MEEGAEAIGDERLDSRHSGWGENGERRQVGAEKSGVQVWWVVRKGWV